MYLIMLRKVHPYDRIVQHSLVWEFDPEYLCRLPWFWTTLCSILGGGEYVLLSLMMGKRIYFIQIKHSLNDQW